MKYLEYIEKIDEPLVKEKEKNQKDIYKKAKNEAKVELE